MKILNTIILQDIKAFIREQEEARQRARDGLVGRLEVEITPWHNYKVRCEVQTGYLKPSYRRWRKCSMLWT